MAVKKSMIFLTLSFLNKVKYEKFSKLKKPFCIFNERTSCFKFISRSGVITTSSETPGSIST